MGHGAPAPVRHERRIIGVFAPDAALTGRKATSGNRDAPRVHEIVGIGRIGDDDLVAVDAERKRAESLQTLERFARIGARRACNPAAPRADTSHAPSSQAASMAARSTAMQILPAFIQLQSRTRNRRIGNRVRASSTSASFSLMKPCQCKVRITGVSGTGHSGERDCKQAADPSKRPGLRCDRVTPWRAYLHRSATLTKQIRCHRQLTINVLRIRALTVASEACSDAASMSLSMVNSLSQRR